MDNLDIVLQENKQQLNLGKNFGEFSNNQIINYPILKIEIKRLFLN